VAESSAPEVEDVKTNNIHMVLPTAARTSRSARFNAIMVTMCDIASYVADQPSETFVTYDYAVHLFRDKLLAGAVDSVVSSLSTYVDHDSDVETATLHSHELSSK